LDGQLAKHVEADDDEGKGEDEEAEADAEHRRKDARLLHNLLNERFHTCISSKKLERFSKI
jgi:hypothetical protein